MIADFGKHALYIWLSYASAFGALAGIWFVTRQSRQRIARDIEALRLLLQASDTRHTGAKINPEDPNTVYKDNV